MLVSVIFLGVMTYILYRLRYLRARSQSELRQIAPIFTLIAIFLFGTAIFSIVDYQNVNQRAATTPITHVNDYEQALRSQKTLLLLGQIDEVTYRSLAQGGKPEIELLLEDGTINIGRLPFELPDTFPDFSPSTDILVSGTVQNADSESPSLDVNTFFIGSLDAFRQEIAQAATPSLIAAGIGLLIGLGSLLLGIQCWRGQPIALADN